MLRISDEQMSVFRADLKRRLENRIFEHACSTYPIALELFGPECTRQLVKSAVKKASQYRLVSEQADRLLFRLILECGVDFDTDPAMAFPGPILTSRAAERERIAQLASAADRYSGMTAPAMRAAAFNLRKFPTAWSHRLSEDEYLKELIANTALVFPQKAALVPHAAWGMIAQNATKSALELGWRTVTAHAMLFVLLFLAGAGVLADPRFAFIATLPIEPSADPALVLHSVATKHFERWFRREA